VSSRTCAANVIKRGVGSGGDRTGNAKPTDQHLASKTHCVDDEIIGWLKRPTHTVRGYFHLGDRHPCCKPTESVCDE
jgi:hypothetical protein